MKKIFVKISWNKRNPAKMATKAHAVITAMTGNNNYKTPKVKLTDLDAAATRVENADANKKNGQLAKDELKNASVDFFTKRPLRTDYFLVPTK